MSDSEVSFAELPKDTSPRKFPCKTCSRETNHQVVFGYREHGDQDCGDGNWYSWTTDKQVIQCMGCDEVSFRVRETNSEDTEPDYDNNHLVSVETITYYPGRVIGSKTISHWDLPWEIGRVYKEARAAVESGLLIIGGIAIRALLESICSDVQAQGRNLSKKIDDLHAKSLITKESVEMLHKIRILGNRAAHRATAHTVEQLFLALEIIEHILIGTYIIPERSKKSFKNLQVVEGALSTLAINESPE